MSPAQNQYGYANLDAAFATARAEAEKAPPYRFTYKGHKYAIPRMRGWTLEQSAMLGAGRFEDLLSGLMSREAYQQLVRDGMINAEMLVVLNAAGEDEGVESLGKPSAPQLRVSTQT